MGLQYLGNHLGAVNGSKAIGLTSLSGRSKAGHCPHELPAVAASPDTSPGLPKVVFISLVFFFFFPQTSGQDSQLSVKHLALWRIDPTPLTLPLLPFFALAASRP